MRFSPVFPALPALLGLLILSAAPPARADGIKAVASIAPVHSLLSGVMQGVATPGLLVRGAGSPHAYAMKPSAARLLNDARLVFWIGPGLEGFLVKPLSALPDRVGVVQLSTGGPEDDPHIWLDPRNAATIVSTMVRALGRADAANRGRYEANGVRMTAMLTALDKEIYGIIKPVAVVPYLVFHDAYRYFEKRFNLASQGAVSVQEGRPPGARRVSALRRKIVDLKIACVFTEPQFEPALARTLTEGTDARLAVLDPLGADLKPGPELYGELMRRMAGSLLGCLGANG
jgi:zinc transport system substrate-binding protein